jgi:hypothetical protein
LYFDEKNVDPDQYKGPLATSASVVSGVTAFAAVSSEKMNVSSNLIPFFFILTQIFNVNIFSAKNVMKELPCIKRFFLFVMEA